MKLRSSIFYFLTISICFYNCSSTDTNSKALASINPAMYLDHGKTIDSLKMVYNCENINDENWDVENTNESCLNICLINSTKVPSFENVEKSHNQLKEIASSIKKELVNPKKYQSFYIVFVKKDLVNGQEIKSQSFGGKIQSSEL